jgi:hypothetical protein
MITIGIRDASDVPTTGRPPDDAKAVVFDSSTDRPLKIFRSNALAGAASRE